MAYSNSNGTFEEMRLQFMAEQDRMLSMLQWLCAQWMEAQDSVKINTQKSERTDSRSGYRSNYRMRRFDTRMGTMSFCLFLNDGKAVMFPSLSLRNPVPKRREYR